MNETQKSDILDWLIPLLDKRYNRQGTFTPTWTSSGTQPVIGNGTLSGLYTIVNKLVVANVFLAPGSSTTFGTGNYYVSMPFGMGGGGLTGGIGALWNGTRYYPFFGKDAGVSNSLAMFGTDSAWQWGATSPITFANGHWMQLSVTYMAS